MTDRPPPGPRTKSGQHPAVGQYRDKLDSIVDNQAEDIDALNRALAEYVKESSVPPPVAVCPDCGCNIDFTNMECSACLQREAERAAQAIS
jgi:hypothetical protein